MDLDWQAIGQGAAGAGALIAATVGGAITYIRRDRKPELPSTAHTTGQHPVSQVTPPPIPAEMNTDPRLHRLLEELVGAVHDGHHAEMRVLAQIQHTSARISGDHATLATLGETVEQLYRRLEHLGGVLRAHQRDLEGHVAERRRGEADMARVLGELQREVAETQRTATETAALVRALMDRSER